MNTQQNKRKPKGNQHGNILPFIAIGMLAMIGVVGLAVDSSHAFVNVTRVQNALDAAALSAAKTLQLTENNTTLATAAGQSTFAEHLNGELGSGGVTVSFQYSATLNPFAPGGLNPDFVRATADNHTIAMWFARVLPGVGDEWNIGSTAVSGPIPLSGGQVCDIAPLLVCGDPTDTDPTDGTIGGLPVGTGAVTCLNFGAGTNAGNGNGNNGNNDDPPDVCGEQAADDPDGVGPGNYHLLRLGGNGGAVVRENLAGGFDGCASILGNVDTEPGVTTGPVAQGLNTRFNEYQGGLSAADFPPDLVVTSPQTHAQYAADYANGNFGTNGEEFRRVMAVPIANCAGIQNGQTSVPVFALGCFFIRQRIEQGGQSNFIVGELIEDCAASGTPGDSIPDLGGPEKIILYNDPDNPAS